MAAAAGLRQPRPFHGLQIVTPRWRQRGLTTFVLDHKHPYQE